MGTGTESLNRELTTIGTTYRHAICKRSQLRLHLVLLDDEIEAAQAIIVAVDRLPAADLSALATFAEESPDKLRQALDMIGNHVSVATAIMLVADETVRS